MKRRPIIYLYRDLPGRWRWRFVHTNGRTGADSGQGYEDVADCKRDAELVVGARRARRMFRIGLPR